MAYQDPNGEEITPVGVTALGATLTASSANAAAANNVTLTPTNQRTAYLSGFMVTGAGATAASVIAVTVTGVSGGTLNFALAIPAGATTAVTPLIVNFPQPLTASAASTNIVVSVPSFGAGNTNAAVTAYGFML